MRPVPRSRCGSPGWLGAGSALGLGTVLGAMLGCDGPARREPPSMVVPSVVDGGSSDPAPVRAVEPAMVDAEPTSVDALEPVARRRFQAAVDEGRRLHEARDYEGALAAFGRALDLVPGDPRTLSEQGWAALFAGRLDEADAALRQAEAAAGPDQPRLRASILYNRGRVAEARGDVAEAIDAYQRSLRLRPHPATYRHLVGLPGGTRYQFGPEVRRLQGPYAKLGELCQEERTLSEAAGEGDEAEPFACLPDAAEGLFADAVDVAGRPLPPPWKALRFVETRPSAWAARFHAALRTDAGWFVLPDVATLVRGTPGTTESVTRLSAHAEPLVAGAPAEVVIDVETRWVVAEDGVELESETHRVEFLCGLGPSGIPSCTGALPRATQARRHEPAEVEPTRWTVTRHTTPEGLLVLDGDREALDEPAAAVLGAHRLAFP